jgi:hypothetical protein
MGTSWDILVGIETCYGPDGRDLISRRARKFSLPHSGQTVSVCFLLHADFLLGSFINPEDGGDMLLQNSVDFQQTTQPYIPEDITLQSYKNLNL